MKYCNKCGKEINDEAIICPGCGCAISNLEPYIKEDHVSVGLCILSFLIPLFGFFYWPIKNKETPKKALACGITAMVSFSLNVLFLL